MVAEKSKKETALTKNLLYYLERNNVMQKDVAQAIGVTTGTFNDWVKGRSAPRMDKIQKLANYFSIDVSDLLEPHETKRYQKEVKSMIDELLEQPELFNFIRSIQKLSAEDRAILTLLVQRLSKEEK